MSAILPAIRSALQPAIRAAISGVYGSSSAWSPLTLFAASEVGVWYDPSDFSTMFQDSAGTTPVTAVGDPVGKILDKSGNLKHATQATAASRPILRNDGTNYYLEFDGVDDSLATAAIDFTATDEMSVFAGLRKANDVVGIVAELSTNMNSNAGAFYFVVNDGVWDWSSKSRGDAAESASQMVYITEAGPATAVIATTHDISGDLTTLRKNGVAATSATANKGLGNFGNYALYLGRRAGASLSFNGRIYSLIVLGRTATALEIAAAEAYVAGKTGVVLP